MLLGAPGLATRSKDATRSKGIDASRVADAVAAGGLSLSEASQLVGTLQITLLCTRRF